MKIKQSPFRTRFNYKFLFVIRNDVYDLTVPGLSMSPAEIISRYARGLPVPGNGTVNMAGDFTGINNLDRFAKIDMARRLAQRKQVLESERLVAEAAKAEADIQARIDAEVTKRSSTPPKQLIVSEVAQTRGGNEAQRE